MPESLVCARCGARFEPRQELLARYPGWRPKVCPACYRTERRGGDTGSRPAGGGNDDTPRARTGGGPATSAPRRRGGSTARRPAGGPEEHLTLAQVLDRYTDGPTDGVFTDGSAIPNPGPGGWGAVSVADGEVVAQDHGHEPHTTNNRMELTALLAALDLVPPGTPAVIYTDSNLAVRTVNEWAAGWAARGWQRKTGPVENLDLVRPLYEGLSARPELELRWIKAHAGNRWNEYADSLATAWARDQL